MLASAKQPTLVLDIFRNMYVVSFSMENNERNLQLVCLVLIFATELVSLPKYMIFFRETCSSYQNITENTKRVFGTPATYEPIAKLGINSPIAKFIGPTWGPPGAYRTKVGSMLAPRALLSGSPPPGQYGRHFASDIFKCIFKMKTCELWLKFHRSFFLRVQLTITRPWFR